MVAPSMYRFANLVPAECWEGLPPVFTEGYLTKVVKGESKDDRKPSFS